MKTKARVFAASGLKAHPFSVPTVVLVAGLMLVLQLQAQTFTVLHTFTASPYSTNSDGANPYAPLVISGDTLYGTALEGGFFGNGTIFKLNTNGTGFATLHTFTGSDGARPYAGLVLSGNSLYGTTYSGGSSSGGTVFKINIDGTGFTTLHSFAYSDGANPRAGFVLSNNILYGTAQNGGALDNGTVFKINTDGTGFGVLHNFTGADGSYPTAGLVLSGDSLYGATSSGGFKVNIGGTGFTYLTNAASGATLLVSGSTLYGAGGALFKVSTNGTGFTNFYRFTPTYNPYYTNGDGQFPNGLILSANTLYGTASAGGILGGGTLIRVNTDGTGFTNLHNFGGSFAYAGGCSPYAVLVLSGDTLYGTTIGCGVSPNGNGTVFSFSLASSNTPPRLTILPFGTSVIVTWPTNATGFILQSATNLSPAVWVTVLPGPVIVNGRNTVLISAPDTQQFYRLSQ